MGEIKTHYPVVRVVAISSRYQQALDWAVEELSKNWGSVFKLSPIFDFAETAYYETTMGSEIKKRLVAFTDLIDPAILPRMKHQSNQWEQNYQATNDFPESRPLNIDPGYLTQAKLILATTKDRDHRIYLSDGIYAEVTLFYKGKVWNGSRWTYPDYCRSEYHDFFNICRRYLRQQLQTI